MGEVNKNNNFIIQTARDYDIDVSQVEIIYAKYGASLEFYEKLEEFIKERANLK